MLLRGRRTPQPVARRRRTARTRHRYRCRPGRTGERCDAGPPAQGADRNRAAARRPSRPTATRTRSSTVRQGAAPTCRGWTGRCPVRAVPGWSTTRHASMCRRPTALGRSWGRQPARLQSRPARLAGRGGGVPASHHGRRDGRRSDGLDHRVGRDWLGRNGAGRGRDGRRGDGRVGVDDGLDDRRDGVEDGLGELGDGLDDRRRRGVSRTGWVRPTTGATTGATVSTTGRASSVTGSRARVRGSA